MTMGTSRQLALRCARIAEDKKASDIAILDMRKLTYFTDYFIICSSDSERQSKAIAEELEHVLKQEGIRRVGAHIEAGPWILADFGDVVCHIFLREVRSFYDLESLWCEAPSLEFKPRKRRKASKTE